jgi:hypothetical protein
MALLAARSTAFFPPNRERPGARNSKGFPRCARRGARRGMYGNCPKVGRPQGLDSTRLGVATAWRQAGGQVRPYVPKSGLQLQNVRGNRTHSPRACIDACSRYPAFFLMPALACAPQRAAVTSPEPSWGERQTHGTEKRRVWRRQRDGNYTNSASFFPYARGWGWGHPSPAGLTIASARLIAFTLNWLGS